MSMDLFRKKQKYVFWGIAICVIPSFVLVWGVGGLGDGGGMHDPVVARVEGSAVHASDLHKFTSRLQAGAGFPVRYLLGIDMFQRAQFMEDINFTMTILLGQLDLARRYGIVVSDEEVRDYLRTEHPILSQTMRGQDSTAENRRKILDNAAKQSEITVDELLMGMREWLTLRRLYELDAALATSSPDASYYAYAYSRSQYVVKRLRFPIDDALKAKARGEFDAFDADRQTVELERVLTGKANDAAFRTPATWRVEYLKVPFAKAELPEPTQNQLYAMYDLPQNAELRKKPFAEVREQLRLDYLNENRMEWASRQVNEEVNRFFTSRLAASDAPAPVTREEILADRNLSRIGVEVGDSGDQALTAEELALLPAFAADPDDRSGAGQVNVKNYLDNLDQFTRLNPTSEEAQKLRKQVVEEFDNNPRPLAAKDGLVRIRVLEWNPSKPMALVDADGKPDAQLREKAVAIWVDEHARQLATEQAADAAGAYRARGADDDSPSAFDALPEQTLSFSEVSQGSDPGLRRRALDTVGDPQPYIGRSPSGDQPGEPDGMEVVLLLARRLPSRADYAALSDVERRATEREAVDAEPSRVVGPLYYQSRGDNSGYPVLGLVPGTFLRLWLNEAYVGQRLAYYPVEGGNR